jgi:large subunit ribosomal protein L3
MNKFIIGEKIEMSQVYREDGTVVPVTLIKAGPCVVTQVKTADKDHVSSVQLGFKNAKRLNKPEAGHLKDLPALSVLRDFRVGGDSSLKRGDTLDASVFAIGDVVDVVGTSKGRGFAGVVKRHGFGGSPASHGHKDQLRMPGSSGAGGPQHVFKGHRMGGHMGDARVTVQNLVIVEIREGGIIAVKGAVPGARHSIVEIITA